MAKTLVTGASGFIGSHVARQLAKRGDELKLAVRKRSSLENLEGLDFEKTVCDVLDPRTLRRAMKGVDKVFHVAGVTDMNLAPKRLFDINVVGTRNVMDEALRASVSRVVHTSSIAAVGAAKARSTVDERSSYKIGKFNLSYADSKRDGEVEVLRAAAHGLPAVIVNPGFVLGRGDIHRSSTFVVRQFLKRQIPVYVDGGLNIVDVNDVAKGHLLADKKGKVGERYILGNQNYSYDRFFAELSRLSGVEPPAVKLPVELALRFAEAAKVLPLGSLMTPELIKSASMWWTCRITKARKELGYSPNHPEETMRETIEWYLEREGDSLGKKRRQPIALRVFGRGIKFNSRIVAELKILAEDGS